MLTGRFLNTGIVSNFCGTSCRWWRTFLVLSHMGMYTLMGIGGTIFVVAVFGIISVVFITEKSFLSSLKKGSSYILESAREDAVRMREYRESLQDEYEDYEEEPEYEEKVRSKRTKKERKSQK